MFKECFVTIGATAKFPELIQAALAPDALEAFVNNGFTRLNLQCGESFDSFESFKPTNTRGLEIKAFSFNMNGLGENMRACQAQKDVSMKGLVICHAGT
jgi:beta-1,4-N-acetylglucosaminyltransferase